MTAPTDYVFPGKVVPITRVEVIGDHELRIGDHELRLTFKDGVVGDVSPAHIAA